MAELSPKDLAMLTARLEQLRDRLEDDPEKAKRLIDALNPQSLANELLDGLGLRDEES